MEQIDIQTVPSQFGVEIRDALQIIVVFLNIGLFPGGCRILKGNQFRLHVAASPHVELYKGIPVTIEDAVSPGFLDIIPVKEIPVPDRVINVLHDRHVQGP